MSSPGRQGAGPEPLRRWLRWPYVMALIGGYAAFFAAQTLLTRQVFTSRYPGANDFYPRWAGGCRLLWEGEDPYSEEITREIQLGVYGRPAVEGEDQVAFAYPLYVLAVTWPTCLSRDFSTVQAVWMTFNLHLLMAGTILMKRIAGWGAKGALWLSTLVWSIFVYPNARALLLGQLSILVFVLIALSLWGLTEDHGIVAGAALAGATIKPQMSLLIVLWLLLWAGGTGRRRFLLGFAGTMLAFLAGSWLLQPDWLAGFLRQLRRYPSYTELASGIWIMTRYYLGAPRIVDLTLTGAAIGLLAWQWISWRGVGKAQMLWLTSLTLVVTHFVSPRTATTHFAVYMLPLFMIFRWWRRQLPSAAGWWTWITLLAIFVGSWALFLLTVEGDQESAINYLPIPLILVATLLLRKRELISAQARPA